MVLTGRDLSPQRPTGISGDLVKEGGGGHEAKGYTFISQVD